MFRSALSLSQFMSNPKELHWQVEKWVRQYLKDPWLWHFISEISWIHDSRGYWFQLGWISWYKEVKNGLCVHSWFWQAISWQSKLQPTVSLSSIDIKYQADFSTGCEEMWLRIILVDLQLDQVVITSLFCDNQSALKMAKHSVYHAITSILKFITIKSDSWLIIKTFSFIIVLQPSKLLT